MIQLIDHIGQPYGINVKHGGRVRIRTHLWRIARNYKKVIDPECRCPEQVGHHSQKIPVAAAIMQDGLYAYLFLNQNCSGEGRHSCLSTRAVGNIYSVNIGIF